MTSKKRKTVKPDSALTILLKSLNQPQARQAAVSEQFPSVFSIARSNTTKLLKSDPLLHISEARSLHAKAIAMTAMVARQFREQRLTASVRRAVRNDSGIKGLVEAPTYTDMFQPDWANQCPPDAIEATTSPIAYLADLYREAAAIENDVDDANDANKGDQDRRLTLATRRPDLAGMVLDHTALNRIEPTLVLVNDILHTSIRSYLDGISNPKSVDDVLLETRYPFALPYERYQQQINYVLNRKQRLPGDPIRTADPAYPYFKEPGVHSLLSDIALIQDTGLGPVQQALLVEAPHTVMAESDASQTALGMRRINPRDGRIQSARSSSPTDFFKDNFGITDSYALTETQTFCLRTGLTADQLDELLSVGAYAPSLSANVKGEAKVDGSAFGSVYINAGQKPAISIESTEENGRPVHRLINDSIDHFDRMNRMIRLARWLALPFDEVDQLLTAAQQAEQRATNVVRRRARADTLSTHLISQDTLRALGLFQVVRGRFDVPAQDFAAMLYGLGVHARGKTQSQFDRVFNSQAMFSIPLILDDSTFNVTPANEAERQKIDHLCAALGMTYEMYRFVAKVIEQSWGGEPLRWTRELVSAFYRLVKLPRYIGLSTIEALALLELLDRGGSRLVSKLAGVTQIGTYNASANTDTLSVIHALVDCCIWLQDHRWTVTQLCRLTLPSMTRPVATDAEHNLLRQMYTRLTSALITDSSFAQVGAQATPTKLEVNAEGEPVYVNASVNWFEELSGVIDSGELRPAAKGLVKYLPQETEESFEQELAHLVRVVLSKYELPEEELHPKITNMIMRARGAQEALLMEGLGSYMNTSADLAKALLFWIQGDRYELLLEVLRVYEAGISAKVAIGDTVLIMLDELSKRAELSVHLTLSSEAISQFSKAPEWFDLRNADLSVQSVFALSQYATNLRASEQDEETLLNYFRLINTVWPDAEAPDRRLIRDTAAFKLAGFIRWSVRDVLAVALHLNPEVGVIFTLRELDTLIRLCALSRHTGLDAKALLALHGLTPTAQVSAYRDAAALALSCLTDMLPGQPYGEVGQSHASTITVVPDFIVANNPASSALFTITLRDFTDEPYEGIRIEWLCENDPDAICTPNSPNTDADGKASMVLSGAKTIGVVQVTARYGLGESLLAPALRVDCDEASLEIIDSSFSAESALANRLGAIDFSVTLKDQFDNFGVDKLVEWGTTWGEFQRYKAWTDENGISQAVLRSVPAGQATVIARYNEFVNHKFDPVDFLSIDYFQYVRFSSVVVVGIDVAVSCRLVEIDGVTPKVGAAVVWSSEPAGGIEVASGTTDQNGVATVIFKPQTPGTVIVKVKTADGKADKESEPTIIHDQSVISNTWASSTYYVGNSAPLEFAVWAETGQGPASGMPVDWAVDETFNVQDLADTDGRSSFKSIFQPGTHTVTATLSGTDVSASFEVVAYPWFEFDTQIEGLLPPEPNPILLGRDNTYFLIVKTVNAAGEAVPGVKFTLSATRLAKSYIQIDPENVEVESSVEGKRFLIKPARYALGWDALLLDARLKILLTTKVGVLAERVYQVGRLVRWQSGHFSRPSDTEILLELQAEWMGEGGSDPNYFNWPPRFNDFTISLPAIGKQTSRLATRENPPAVNDGGSLIDYPLSPGPTMVEVAEKMVEGGFLYSFPFSIELDVPPEN